MKTTDKKYFIELGKRNFLKTFLRKIFFLRPIVKKFRGKVLDIGCGFGDFLKLYSNACGIDNNRFIVKFCKNKGLNCYFGSIYSIPFKNKSFDGVLCYNILEHLENIEKAVIEIKSVLKHGGKLIIVVPIAKKTFKKDRTHRRFLTENNLIPILIKYGFKIEKINYFPFPFKILRERFYFSELRIFAIKIK